jgi:hypothetical protein
MKLVRPEVFFALVYAVFLILISHILRWRAGRMRQPFISDVLQGSTMDFSWTHGLASRFRLGLSAGLLVITGFIIFAAGLRYHRPLEATLLIGMGGATMIDGFMFYRRSFDAERF